MRSVTVNVRCDKDGCSCRVSQPGKNVGEAKKCLRIEGWKLGPAGKDRCPNHHQTTKETP